MAQKIQVRRGLKADLPILDNGELGFAFDTQETFIGSGYDNIQLAKQEDVEQIVRINSNTLSTFFSDTSKLITVLIPFEVNITTNLTVPSNFILKFSQGGKFTVSNGITLTINGIIEAGFYQIFGGSGTVNGLPRIEAVYPEWFGAKVNDTLVDNAPLFDKAQRFFPYVKLSTGTYHFQTDFTPVYSATFEGASRLNDFSSNVTVLKQLSDLPTIRLGAPNATIKNLNIAGSLTNPNNDGILFPCLGSGTKIERVWIRECGGNGIHASGSSALGVDYVHVSDVKVEKCEGYGVKLNIDQANPSGFNTSLFENVECAKNRLGGFYADKSQSLTFLRCHAFQNSNKGLVSAFGYELKGNANNIVFTNCWSEGSGEHDFADPQHKSAGFLVDGAKNITFNNCDAILESRGFHIKAGENIIINTPNIGKLNWATSLDILIDLAAKNVRVTNYIMPDGAVVANFSDSSVVEANKEMPTTGRLPFNSFFKRGLRGKAHAHKQGTYTLYQYNATVSGTAGTNYLVYTTNSLKVGDNILIPGAGTSGAGLTAQITDLDMVSKRLYLNTNIVTSVSSVIPATTQAGIYSETFGTSTSAISNPQEGDTIYTIFPNAHGHSGWKCTVGGGTPTWKTWGTLV